MILENIVAYFVELGAAAVKDKFRSKMDEQTLKKDIEKYASRQFEKVFKNASLAEEIDYGASAYT